ncbi:unnamed protein product [Cladocopium goreaui]|uniref:Flagellar attachment zone protein 1 n=1 Tax=Cladocopium goreaui TaxID=2562237 RepID=A0A9P1CX98_9DINO|nr:unnamed protein product [Cladocopium goreaui]
MLACHVLCVFEVGLVVAIVLARMQARSPFMPSMDLEAAVFDLGPLIVRQNNWVAAVAAAITEVFFAVFKCQWHGLQIVADPTGDLLKEVGRLSQREFCQNIGWGRNVRGKIYALTKDTVLAGFAQAWAEGGGLWIEKLAIEGSFRRRGLCRRFLELLAQHATGVFRLASLRTSEAAWTGLGFETIGRNSEGLKLMQCPISVFLHGSPPQQEELTSSQQREPGADDLERTLLQSQRRCEELERKSVTMAHQCENLERMLAQSQRVAEEAQARADDLERTLLQSQRRCEELERKSVTMAHQCENLERMLAQSQRVAEEAQARADDLEHTLLQSQRRCEELERKSVTMAHQCENLEGMLARSQRVAEEAQARADDLERTLLQSQRRCEELERKSVTMLAQSQWVAEEAQARAGDLERMVLQSQRRCEDLEQKSAENLGHLLAQTRYCEELERKNVALAHQCENLEHLLGQARSVAEAAQSQADALEHMLFQSQRRCEDRGQKNLAVAQQCENLEHVLLQETTRPGFEEAHAQAIFKKYLDLRDWTAEQLVRRAEYAEFQHWSCWPAAHMWAC